MIDPYLGFSRNLLTAHVSREGNFLFLSPIFFIFAFSQFEEIFAPYSRYCSEQTNCQEYCRDEDRKNEVFKAYLAWCETQKVNDSTLIKQLTGVNYWQITPLIDNEFSSC